MNLEIRPFHKNIFPIQGILIKSKNLEYWLFQLQLLKIDLLKVPVFAIADTSANSIWGCFIALDQSITKDYQIKNLQLCQSIQNKLFIPEYSNLFPKLNSLEIDKLFAANPHVFHPEFGLFELEHPIIWEDLLDIDIASIYQTTTPATTPFYPHYIQKIEIKALPPEELLQSMEDNIFPKKEEFKDESLNWKEKIKYNILKPFFKTYEVENGDTETQIANWFEKVASWVSKISPNNKQRLENIENDFKNLEKRNSSEIEKLMALFKNNPEEALKYAIPIDNEGTSRGGGSKGTFSMNKRWLSFGLFGNNGIQGGGNMYLEDNSMSKLQQQYSLAASNFIREKNYEKAAFVYLKLLKNNHLAASTLEEGKLYPEAASLYLKYLKNKEKAASCYEKGRMTSDAINLYKELNMNEKIGDLYASINNLKEANLHYNYVIDDYKTKNQFVKAALLLRNKIGDTTSAQETLLTGWREQKDSFNCLNNYFENIADIKQLSNEIDKIYLNDTKEYNKAEFLKVLKFEYKKDPMLAIQTKEIAYEIVSTLAAANPNILNELPAFNKDTQLNKDISRYKKRKV